MAEEQEAKIDKLESENGRLANELAASRKAAQQLSAAYVRLRALIPGAFDTPFAPTGEQIWKITERALKKLLRQVARAIR